ncbi:MAG: xylose isomerase [Holophaga sp.]|nr:xylose isomerase [Holophaga sp.]
MSEFFKGIGTIPFEGVNATSPLAYRYYDRERVVLGKRMEDHLRFAVCYWHSFGWNGNDPFGGDTFQHPWHALDDAMAGALMKADVAFEFFVKLGAPFYTFHDRDLAPEGATVRETVDNLRRMVDVLAGKQEATGIRLLWGTANLFSHRRWMAGAASNPDPDVFAMACLSVKEAMDATLKLGGQNFVMWGGREGYETLLNTDLKAELDQMGRFLGMAVDYKHKIGLDGPILIEPKPREPTKNQYDYDTSAVAAFLLKYGLEKEVKLNLESNHATLAGHTFEHEVALASAYGLFGSLDMNRGDLLCGWDTDQFPNNLGEVALVMYHILKAGGLTTGGLNFDAKIRRQSIAPDDLFQAHVGAMDLCARALLVAERMVSDGQLDRHVQERYAGWQGEYGQRLLSGQLTFEAVAARVLDRNVDTTPRSGRQEYLENLLNRYI